MKARAAPVQLHRHRAARVEKSPLFPPLRAFPSRDIAPAIIHPATIHSNFGVRYLNCGDWVESCTAIAEHHDGHFEIINWANAAPPIEMEVVPLTAQAA